MNSKLSRLIQELCRKENALTSSLEQFAKRHPGQHEIFHVARDLKRWSAEHAAQLEEIANRHSIELPSSSPDDRFREVGPDADPGQILLADLRSLYLEIADLSIDWELLGQAAVAVTNRELHELVSRCQPRTQRQLHWANGLVKTSSPQYYAS